MLRIRSKQVLLPIRNTLLDSRYWPASRREFNQHVRGLATLAQAVDFIYSYQGQGFYRRLKPNQDRSEILTLAERVQSIAPKVVVEIGTRAGGTLFLWTRCARMLELLVSIDLPGGIHGGGYPAPRGKLYRLFVQDRPTAKLALLRMDSQAGTTKAKLTGLLANRPIDFLFIDGDHRYPGVKRDYELYASLVRPGGLIAFHDIRPNVDDTSIEVFRLWNEIKNQRLDTEEIIHQPYTGRYGIGLVRVPET